MNGLKNKVTEVLSCLSVGFGSFIIVNREVLSAKSFGFD